jgi:uncharacterized protein (TIGR03067 family)
MKTAFGMVLIATIIAGTCLAGEQSADLKFFQGNWNGTFIEIDGKPPTEKDLALKITLVVEGSNFKVYDKTNVLASGKLVLATDKKTKTIDAIFGDGPAKGLVQPGIYQLKEDEILINFALPGKDRPTEFKTTTDGKETLLKYTRAKK